MKRLALELGAMRLTFELGRIPKQETRGNQFPGVYASWDEAKKYTAGYDAPSILQKAILAMRRVRDGEVAFERDTVTFDKPEVVYPLLNWLLYAATVQHNMLRVLDFGGALGSSYYQHRHLLSHLDGLKWGVVEQQHFVHAGQAEFQDSCISYHESLEGCIAAIQPNFIVVSGVLQYLENPWVILDQLLNVGAPYMLIDRTMAQRELPDHVSIQHVPPSIYDASYPLWMLDAQRLEQQFKANGYEIVDCFDPYPGSTFGPNNANWPYIGWFLRKAVLA